MIAHRNENGDEQPLIVHLDEVGEIAAGIASKIELVDAGRLLGLLHDLGKYSEEFQNYIGSATGKISSEDKGYVDFDGLKGKIDHSSAGAQWVWEQCQKWGGNGQLVGQILALILASHHSGLIDALKSDGRNGFIDRMEKTDERTHKTESLKSADTHLIQELENLLDLEFVRRALIQIEKITKGQKHVIRQFNLGFFTRMLFSCLIDADRINSADFENPENKLHRNTHPIDWSIAINRFEQALSELEGEKPIDELRRNISKNCRERALEKQGIYTLTVPTGGGKTYASLRYALHHAEKHELDRIIYIIPFTSIIEQNAAAIRELIEDPVDDKPWVLEVHSSLEPERQTWHSKLVSENWDAPIVMTTMVQFLEVLFSGGTRGARKMHQLANAVLIFDEIQTLPINCTHLFCNAINYLTDFCNTTALLCTATQPLLNKLKIPEKGQLTIPQENELMPDLPKLFADLERVTLSNKIRPQGWTAEQIATLAMEEYDNLGSCLIIVNTKGWAQQLYVTLKNEYQIDQSALFHLSTNLCPAHRKAIFARIKKRLWQELPVLCISTQLIEAGVDVDFASVIRFLAGLDSIAQAAGRCNRNGRFGKSTIHILNPDNEPIEQLTDIKVGKEAARRVLDEGYENIVAPEAIGQYFNYYFYERAKEMSYPVSAKQTGRDDDLLNLLSCNNRNIGWKPNTLLLQHSFMTAGRAFKAIDSPTQAVIVPHGDEGRALISELCRVAKEFEAKRYRQLLREAQQYSVNVFPNVWKRLLDEKAANETQPGEGIYHLDSRYYSEEFGLSEKPCNLMEANIC
jgi:CRISPR-associated endonuclease/helicase Cas3